MLKHIWSVLCRRAIVDSSTNSLTISDVLEELKVDIRIEKRNEKVDQQIKIPLEFEIVTFLEKITDIDKPVKGACEIDLLNPEGKKLKTFYEAIDMPADMKRLRAVLRVNGFVIDGSGDYKFIIKLNEEGQSAYSVAEIPLTVHLNKEIIPNISSRGSRFIK